MKETNKEQVHCASREDGLSGICSHKQTELVLEVAKYIVSEMSKAGKPVNIFVLQDMLYYTQQTCIELFGHPAFLEDFEVRMYGLTLRSVRREYCMFGAYPIYREHVLDPLSPHVKEAAGMAMDKYGSTIHFHVIHSYMDDEDHPWTRAQKAECLTVTEIDIREYLRRKRERMWNE
jgi:uncharacterized phage-associated protein